MYYYKTKLTDTWDITTIVERNQTEIETFVASLVEINNIDYFQITEAEFEINKPIFEPIEPPTPVKAVTNEEIQENQLIIMSGLADVYEKLDSLGGL